MRLQSLEASPDDASTGAAKRPRIDAFDMHPIDYGLVQKAAALQGLQLVDFVTLAAYRTACDVVAEESKALFPRGVYRKDGRP